MNDKKGTRTGTKIAFLAVILIILITCFRSNILPLLIGDDKLKIIEPQTPAIIMWLLIVAVIFHWGSEGRKTVENVLLAKFGVFKDKEGN